MLPDFASKSGSILEHTGFCEPILVRHRYDSYYYLSILQTQQLALLVKLVLEAGAPYFGYIWVSDGAARHMPSVKAITELCTVKICKILL